MSNKTDPPLFANIEDSKAISPEHETIGLSEQQRPLAVRHLGGKDAHKLKIFVIAGQHGNEKYGRKAANLLVDSMPDFDSRFPSVHLAVLSDANPDGSVQKTRRNAMGIDLNRDHQRLDSKENTAIHGFVRRWRPHVIIDVHNIGSKRKDLLAKNLILYHDVFIDTPTNPAARQVLDSNKMMHFLQSVRSHLMSLGITCDKYAMLKRSDRVRFSTLDVNEALNAFSLRYGILTVLLEGRTPIREEGDADRKHVVSAQHNALLAIIKWMEENKGCLTENNERHAPSKGDAFALRSRYRPTDEPFKMIFRNSVTRNVQVVALKNNYTSKLEITKYIKLPAAYAVPSDKAKVIEILGRQGFVSHASDPSRTEIVEHYEIVPREAGPSKTRTRQVMTVGKAGQRRLDGYTVFPTSQEGGGCLAMFLEPRSPYGLNRYNDLGLSALPGVQYPILRVL